MRRIKEKLLQIVDRFKYLIVILIMVALWIVGFFFYIKTHSIIVKGLGY